MKILIEIDADTQRVVPVEPHVKLPELPINVAKGNLGVRYYDGIQMHQYAVKYMSSLLAAAPQPEPVDAWQPIETAPKNIEIFIGRFIDGVFVFGKAVCFYEVGNEFEGEFYRGWFWSIDDVCESVAECPTHWMPLPKPPAMSQGEQK